jgi:hypothetical protein
MQRAQHPERQGVSLDRKSADSVMHLPQICHVRVGVSGWPILISLRSNGEGDSLSTSRLHPEPSGQEPTDVRGRQYSARTPER